MIDAICRGFSPMERSAYNLVRDGATASSIKFVLRERYGIKNVRWIQSALNQAMAIRGSQEEALEYRIEQYGEKVMNTKEKLRHVSNPSKVEGCEAKIEKYESIIEELKKQLKEKSYPMAVFGSRRLLHKLSIAGGERRAQLKKEWRERRSSHFFSVGQANQRGNGNTRLLCEDGKFSLEIRNWFDGDDGDFRVPLHVPNYCKDMLKGLISKAEAVRLDQHGALVGGGMAYSVRVIRCEEGYQVLISFELDERNVGWNGGRVAGIDINPEGIACTVVSKDGNLIATRFFRDNRLISASKSKRKWVLENLINRMLRWCSRTHGCNAITLEGLKLKGAYDYGSRTNYKLSNFMRRRMIEVIKLHAFKMNVVTVEVNPAYSSMVATIKYRKQFGGFNRHHLAAFVIARRALGYGEAPALSCLPGKKEKEKRMWNHCVRYYGYSPVIQTLLHHEPMEWKSGGDDNGGGGVTELLKAPPADTRKGLSHCASASTEAVEPGGITIRRAGRAHSNGHTSQGDGARGYRVNPPSS